MSFADAPVIAPCTPPPRVLLGPGPSPVDERVLRVLGAPLSGHLDPFFVRTMDEVQQLLRYVFETNNRLTIPVSGTGSAGMEATVANLLEPGEEIVVCINGYFGERMHEMALRVGAVPIRVECEWGGPVDIEKARAAWRSSNARVLFAVQAETSTGVLQREVSAGDAFERVRACAVDFTLADAPAPPTNPWATDVLEAPVRLDEEVIPTVCLRVDEALANVAPSAPAVEPDRAGPRRRRRAWPWVALAGLIAVGALLAAHFVGVKP